MGVGIIDGKTRAAFYDDTTNIAFGPTFGRREQAVAFQAWVEQRTAYDGVRDLWDDLQWFQKLKGRWFRLEVSCDYLGCDKETFYDYTTEEYRSYCWKHEKQFKRLQ